jgi:hypothetical protein
VVQLRPEFREIWLPNVYRRWWRWRRDGDEKAGGALDGGVHGGGVTGAAWVERGERRSLLSSSDSRRSSASCLILTRLAGGGATSGGDGDGVFA